MKELIKKLTEHYEWCIHNMPEENWKDFIIDNFIYFGICHCAESKFNIKIYGSKFASDFSKGLPYLCEIGSDCDTFKESLATLRIRHKRLIEMVDYED